MPVPEKIERRGDKYKCRKCGEWKRKEAFNVDNVGYHSRDGVRSMCRKCTKARDKEYWKRRGSELKKRRTQQAKRKEDIYISFMENNKKRMDFGLDPLLVMPGVSKSIMWRTVEEARAAVTKWYNHREFMKTEAGAITREIDEIRRKMSLVTHLSRQTQVYQRQIDTLSAKLKEMKSCNEQQNDNVTS